LSKNGLITTIAWGLDGDSICAGGSLYCQAAVQWLRDGLHLIDQSKDSEYFATKALGSNEVYVCRHLPG
jgi:glycerol kinase